ncbi:MAG: M48 family metallopeptidase [Desulfobaccales bacterium]
MAARKQVPPRNGWRCVSLLLAFMVLAGCATAPYTGRKQVLMVSSEREQALGYQAFSQIRGKSRPSQDQALQARVKKVGARVAQAANRPDFQWEFVVFDDDKNANAFCLPGGKVGIYTGLFKYIKSDADLATVISHEAAHALARHAGERLSQARLANAGGMALGVGLAALGAGSGASQLAMQGYSLGAQVGVLLPYSRLQESEADRIGLILMAKAGYDPDLAVQFWERFATGKKDKAQVPQFLSTHPSDATRIATMKKFLDEARQYYKAGGGNPPQTGGQWSTHQNRPRGQPH